MITFLLVGACGGSEPAAEPTVRVERPSFNATTAYAQVRTQVEFGPRVPGTQGHADQLAWMLDLLGTHADTVLRDNFEYTTSRGESLELTNLMARFNPDSTRRIMLLTHWDTRPNSDQSSNMLDRETPLPGANDGGSGTAVLLQLAELFAQQPPPMGVDLLFVDGEDYGPGTTDMYLGARHYAENWPEDDRPVFAILLDMVGDLDPSFPVEGNSATMAPQLVQKVYKVAREMGYARFFPMTVGAPINDDHLPLNRAGIPTIDIIDFEYGPGNVLWHTAQDVPENVSPESLRMVGEVMAEFIYRGG